MNKIKEIVSVILAKREEVPIERSLLVGISGIDASGKGFVTAKLIEELAKTKYKCGCNQC